MYRLYFLVIFTKDPFGSFRICCVFLVKITDASDFHQISYKKLQSFDVIVALFMASFVCEVNIAVYQYFFAFLNGNRSLTGISRLKNIWFNRNYICANRYIVAFESRKRVRGIKGWNFMQYFRQSWDCCVSSPNIIVFFARLFLLKKCITHFIINVAILVETLAVVFLRHLFHCFIDVFVVLLKYFVVNFTVKHLIDHQINGWKFFIHS